MFSDAVLTEALEVLGAILNERNEAFDIVVIGGGALLLLGFIDRPTRDLDVLARVVGDEWIRAEPLPPALSAAVRDVAAALDLAPEWLNPGPASLVDLGLPAGVAERAEVRIFGSLTVRLASRDDHVAFKLYAAADHWPDQSRHLADLRKLQPSPEELLAAARWCRTHDPSLGFLEMQLRPTLHALGLSALEL